MFVAEFVRTQTTIADHSSPNSDESGYGAASYSGTVKSTAHERFGQSFYNATVASVVAL